MRLLHLSDPHLGTEQPVVLEALLSLAHRLAPQALLISGDLTQRATPAQFAAAAGLLARLPAVPRLVIPGNHDIPLWRLWPRLRQPYAGYEQVCGLRPPGGVAQFDLPGARVVAVDTTRWWRHRHGTLSAAQIDAVAQRLHDAPAGAWRIVMSHHPLAVAQEADHEDRPWRHRRALQAWQQAGAELLISGHLHVPALIRVGPRCWVAQAGSSVSRRLAPTVANSVQLLVDEPASGPGCAPGRCCLRYDYDGVRQAFMPAARHALRALRDPLPWRPGAWAT
ncbi:metallophosphoesterase family protein [Aquabacterium sp. OR-4]|uniref:metallophosphoesterase family protein n=1 Tax=Aquabacterium sp. OR-4 TaxID=2978127 RepID=UPI0021B20062|nr:metallophosphoesterase [Aquabacterium sp. OR-4]MDT7835061.1 metallophosphoesterase [Aquabacterium sp. OR-4]